MKTVLIDQKYRQFIEEYAQFQTKGGFSNLKSKDLNKASRYDYQLGGVSCEVGWFLYRYGSIDPLKKNLDFKREHFDKTGKGDGGFDDSITANGKTRLIDIKSSHCESEDRIPFLNLVIPPREMHKNMIYVAAFSIGKDRKNIDKVVLQGWCINEDVHKKWPYDNIKWCVPVKELRPMEELEKYLFDKE